MQEGCAEGECKRNPSGEEGNPQQDTCLAVGTGRVVGTTNPGPHLGPSGVPYGPAASPRRVHGTEAGDKGCSQWHPGGGEELSFTAHGLCTRRNRVCVGITMEKRDGAIRLYDVTMQDY